MKSRNYAGISLLASLAACNSATAETVQKKTVRKTRKSPMLSLFWQMTWDMEI